MDQVKIYLSCGGGLSSGFLAQQTRKAAKKSGENVLVEAISESEIPRYLDKIDILLLGPHYAFRQKPVEELSNGRFPVLVIPSDVYSQLDGKALLEIALKELKGEE